MSRGPFPNGPQGGYPMGHPHNMGGGPGPGFSGMPPGMHGRPGISGPGGMGGGPMVSMQGGQFPVSSSNSSHHLGQQQPGMRPGGPGGSSGHPSGGAPGQPGYHSPGSFPSPARGVKTEVPTVSPRGGGISPPHAKRDTCSLIKFVCSGGLSSFQHSPVPGNPTPPLTPNGPGGSRDHMNRLGGNL